MRIDRKALGDRQHVQVYAEDLANAAWQSFALAEVPTKFTDQRLARNLDPAKPFTQRKEITVLEKGKTLTLGRHSNERNGESTTPSAACMPCSPR